MDDRGGEREDNAPAELVRLLVAIAVRVSSAPAPDVVALIDTALGDVGRQIGAGALSLAEVVDGHEVVVATWAEEPGEPGEPGEPVHFDATKDGRRWRLSVVALTGAGEWPVLVQAVLETLAQGFARDLTRGPAQHPLQGVDDFGRAVLEPSHALIGRWGTNDRLQYVNDSIEELTGISASSFVGLVRLVTEISEGRELLATLIDDSPDVILRLHHDGTVVFANDAWRRVFGGLLDAPEHHTVEEIGRLFGQGEALARHFGQVLVHGTATVDVWRLPEALGAAWIEVRLVPERDTAGLTEHVLVLMRDVTEQHMEEAALVAAAGSDPLTGLANRRVLLDAMRRQLATAQRTGCTVGVLYLDVDHFKEVNDAFGHRAGDDLLRAVGDRLVAVVRPADLVGRQGGDEFIVIVAGVTNASEVDTVARRLLVALDAPVTVAGLPVQVSASIGVAIASETGANDPEELLREADVALYEAKRAGRNRYVHFRSDLGNQADHRTALAGLLDDAVSRGELAAYLQPEVDPRTGRVVAVEALARWCRPGRPPEPAQAFLELVHDRHVQAAIDLAVVEQAAVAVAELDRTRTGPRLDLRVNLARETLRDDGVADTLVALFARVRVSPERVTIEFDNRDLMALAPAEIAALERIHDAGFSVGIDNVELPERFDIDPARRLRVGRIAIIPSVVSRLGEDELADALFAGVVVALGRLGITVTAVGVEDAEQAEVARSLGIHAQGRWYGTVGPADHIGEAIDRAERGGAPSATPDN